MTNIIIKEPKTIDVLGEEVTFPQLPLGKFLEAQKLYYQILSPMFGLAESVEDDDEITMDGKEVLKALPLIMQEQPEIVPRFMAAGSNKGVDFWKEKAYIEHVQEAYAIIIEQNDFNRTLMNSPMENQDEKPGEQKKTDSSQ